MSLAQDTGYLPNTVPQLMGIIRQNVNTQFGTTYGEDTFVGTNFYKFFYALVQRLQEAEVKTSEIFLRMQEYFNITNEVIQRPTTTHPGLFDYFASKGYLVSSKAPAALDAGKLYVCVDLDNTADDYAEKRLDVCNILKDCTVAGVVTQGTEVEEITLSNDQAFEYRFNLPNRVPIKLRLTLTISANNQFTIPATSETRAKLFENINSRYRLGMAFEPQRYFSVIDAPWAGSVLLEYSLDDGALWSSAVYNADYDDVFEFDLDDIEVIEV